MLILIYLTKGFKEYCFNKIDELNFYLDALRKSYKSKKSLNKDVNSLNKKNLIHDYYINQLLNTLDNKTFINFMFYSLFIVVTFNNMVLEDENLSKDESTKIGLTTISISLGKYLSNKYIYYNYIKSRQSPGYRMVDTRSCNMKFSEYKKCFLTLDKNIELISDVFYIRLAGKLVEIMGNCNLWSLKVLRINDKKTVTILSLTEEMEKNFR